MFTKWKRYALRQFQFTQLDIAVCLKYVSYILKPNDYRIADWSCLIEKVEGSISIWQERWLSRVGRLVLIKLVVLEAICGLLWPRYQKESHNSWIGTMKEIKYTSHRNFSFLLDFHSFHKKLQDDLDNLLKISSFGVITSHGYKNAELLHMKIITIVMQWCKTFFC